MFGKFQCGRRHYVAVARPGSGIPSGRIPLKQLQRARGPAGRGGPPSCTQVPPAEGFRTHWGRPIRAFSPDPHVDSRPMGSFLIFRVAFGFCCSALAVVSFVQIVGYRFVLVLVFRPWFLFCLCGGFVCPNCWLAFRVGIGLLALVLVGLFVRLFRLSS